jgi:hypothetical protein
MARNLSGKACRRLTRGIPWTTGVEWELDWLARTDWIDGDGSNEETSVLFGAVRCFCTLSLVVGLELPVGCELLVLDLTPCELRPWDTAIYQPRAALGWGRISHRSVTKLLPAATSCEIP